MTYTSLVLRVKFLAVVWWITNMQRGGVYQPGDICYKTLEMVMVVLQAKHPEACPDTEYRFSSYESATLDLVQQDITEYMVIYVGHRISSGIVLGGDGHGQSG